MRDLKKKSNFEDIQYKVDECKKKISDLISKENIENVKKNLKEIRDAHDSTSIPGVWNTIKKMYPKVSSNIVVGKKDHKGRIVTEPTQLKKLHKRTFKQRLRERPMIPTMKRIGEIQKTIFSLRFKKAKKLITPPWTMKELETVLRSLKDNKARDHEGLTNELFKLGTIGIKLKTSLLKILNLLKSKQLIPDFMLKVNVAMIYKRSGDRLLLQNQRGIFLVSILRFILMRLIYNRKYSEVDKNMSDSNMGARKGKDVRNHMFVVNNIIHDVKNKSVDIQVYDYRQMFDAMNLKEFLNDIYEAGVDDDNMSLLYNSNKKNQNVC